MSQPEKSVKQTPGKKRLVILISGTGSNLNAIIDGTADGRINADIVAVISNRPDAAGLERATKAGIKTLGLDHKSFASREAFDEELQARIEEFRPDFVILAGFMRILTAPFVRHFQGRMLNIHPSLLPLYPGLNTHARALEAGDTRHGATVHFVTEDLDGGPAIAQALIPVLPGDTPEKLAGRLLIQEHILYPQVLHWLCDGKVTLEDSRVLLNGEALPECGVRINAV